MANYIKFKRNIVVASNRADAIAAINASSTTYEDGEIVLGRYYDENNKVKTVQGFVYKDGNKVTINFDTNSSSSATGGSSSIDEEAIKEWVSENYADKNSIPTVPTKVSDLTNDLAFVSDSRATEISMGNAELAYTSALTWVENQHYVTSADTDALSASMSSWVEGQGYATKRWVEEKHYATSGWVTDQHYATTGDIPTQVSELANDANYATTSLVSSVSATVISTFIGTSGDTSGDTTVYGIKAWVEEQGYTRDALDLSDYATTEDVASAKEEASGAAKTWVERQGYVTSGWVGNQGYATTGVVASASGAVQEWVGNQHYATTGVVASAIEYATLAKLYAKKGNSGLIRIASIMNNMYASNEYDEDYDIDGDGTISMEEVQRIQNLSTTYGTLADYLGLEKDIDYGEY